jgi:competence protein ComEC
MYYWIPFAFVRIVVFFTAGILTGIFLPFGIPLLPVVFMFFTFAVSYVLMASSEVIRRSVNPGLAGLIAVLLAGFIHVQLRTESAHPSHLSNLPVKPECYRVVIAGYVQQKEKSWKAEGEVLEIRNGDTWKNYQGKVLLYFSKEFPGPPEYGDELIIQGSPQEVREPLNPGEFDYKQFLAYRNIHHQHFVRPRQTKWIGNDPPNQWKAWAFRTRIWADHTLAKYIDGSREQAIASALVLGITDGLDNELLSAYGSTGTLHVLAVSGLHISIIYMIILWLLTPLNKSTSGKWAIAIISIVVLWGYAFVTGLSPSVLRAVTMFTFIALAKPWKQKVNIYNSLAASAFFLLWFDPHMIMSVGFQLSYLAVLGIVYMHPKIYQWWEPESRILDEIWKITSVSIAAQIATLPLGLLYFHQFPNYFLLSNLLVIPASFVVLVGGLVILALSSFAWLAKFVGWILAWTVKAMNVIVFTIEGFPFSTLENIIMTPFQAVVLAAMIVCILLLFDRRKFYYAWILFALVMLFSGSRWWYDYRVLHQQKLLVYSVQGHSAIDLIDGSTTAFLADTALLKASDKIRYHLQPARMQHGITQALPLHESNMVKQIPGARLLIWKNKTILIVEDDIALPVKYFKVDYLVISHNAVRNLEKVAFIDAEKIIVDSSNSFYLAGKLVEQGKTLKRNIYSVMHQGAYQEII